MFESPVTISPPTPMTILNGAQAENAQKAIKAQEDDLSKQIPVGTQPITSSPTQLFQKYIDTGDTVFKQAAGQALSHLTSLAQGAGNTILDSVSTHVQSTDNNQAERDSLAHIDSVRNAIAKNETGGITGDTYMFARPSGSTIQGRALGKYQVTEGELKTYAPMFLGQPITPSQFLASPQLQDMYMDHKISHIMSQNPGVSDEQIFDAHRSGMSKPITTILHPNYDKAAMNNLADANGQ